MKNNKFIIRSVTVLFISIALCIVSVLGARAATNYDLGQIAYITLIFFPITAVIIGGFSCVYLQRFWMAPIISLCSFLITMLVYFKVANFIYILVYMGLSLIGYMLVYLIKGAANRKGR